MKKISAKIIDNELVKEDEVRKTLEKVNIDHFINAEELAEKLKEITEEAAAAEAGKVTIVESNRSSLFSVLGQSKDRKNQSYDLPTSMHSDEDYMIKDNITGFLD